MLILKLTNLLLDQNIYVRHLSKIRSFRVVSSGLHCSPLLSFLDCIICLLLSPLLTYVIATFSFSSLPGFSLEVDLSKCHVNVASVSLALHTLGGFIPPVKTNFFQRDLQRNDAMILQVSIFLLFSTLSSSLDERVTLHIAGTFPMESGSGGWAGGEVTILILIFGKSSTLPGYFFFQN